MRSLKTLFLLMLLLVTVGVFAQGQDFINFADGEGVVTELTFINPGEDPTQFLVEVYNLASQPAEITLEEFGNYGYFFVPLKAKEVWSCRTTGESLPFHTGKIQVTPLGAGMVVVTLKQEKLILAERVIQ